MQSNGFEGLLDNPTTPLKFYTDTHVSKAVAVQLREMGVDIIRCEEVDMATASDLAHLEYAVRDGRTMVTRDADFLRLHAKWLAEGKPHSGIMFLEDHLQGKGSVGTVVKVLFDYHELVLGGAATMENDIANQVIFIG